MRLDWVGSDSQTLPCAWLLVIRAQHRTSLSRTKFTSFGREEQLRWYLHLQCQKRWSLLIRNIEAAAEGVEERVAVFEFTLAREILDAIEFDDCHIVPDACSAVINGLAIPLTVKVYPKGLKLQEDKETNSAAIGIAAYSLDILHKPELQLNIKLFAQVSSCPTFFIPAGVNTASF